jgi:hypothetical protein
MKPLILALLLFSSHAFAADTHCYDAFRHIVLGEDGRVTLNGFDLMGLPTGATFDCRQPKEDDCSQWLSPERILCQSDPIGHGHIILQVNHVMGVRTALLYSSNGLPYFMGICSALHISY